MTPDIHQKAIQRIDDCLIQIDQAISGYEARISALQPAAKPSAPPDPPVSGRATPIAVQKRLNQLGFSCGKADGFFGAKTEAAIRAFQGARGLAADGLIGPKTLAALGFADTELYDLSVKKPKPAAKAPNAPGAGAPAVSPAGAPADRAPTPNTTAAPRGAPAADPEEREPLEISAPGDVDVKIGPKGAEVEKGVKLFEFYRPWNFTVRGIPCLVSFRVEGKLTFSAGANRDGSGKGALGVQFSAMLMGGLGRGEKAIKGIPGLEEDIQVSLHVYGRATASQSVSVSRSAAGLWSAEATYLECTGDWGVGAEAGPWKANQPIGKKTLARIKLVSWDEKAGLQAPSVELLGEEVDFSKAFESVIARILANAGAKAVEEHAPEPVKEAAEGAAAWVAESDAAGAIADVVEAVAPDSVLDYVDDLTRSVLGPSDEELNQKAREEAAKREKQEAKERAAREQAAAREQKAREAAAQKAAQDEAAARVKAAEAAMNAAQRKTQFEAMATANKHQGKSTPQATLHWGTGYTKNALADKARKLVKAMVARGPDAQIEQANKAAALYNEAIAAFQQGNSCHQQKI